MRHWLVIVSTLALGLGVVSVAQQPTKKAPDIPGVTGKDPFMNGCVSCHVVLPDGKDMRISQAMKALKKHPDVSKTMKNIPMDCMSCHPTKTAMGLDRKLHPLHYGKQEKSVFVTEFNGTCTNCHSMNLKTGKIGIKSGLKNW